MDWTIEKDLGQILSQAENVFRELRGANIFITGGTGFIGTWILETIRYANQTRNFDIHASILTRNKESYFKRNLRLASHNKFSFIEGDISSFDAPDSNYSHVIHGATDASAYLNEHDPIKMFNTVVDGTKRILEFAKEKQAARVLMMSSGAVYGQQPYELQKVGESWLGGPNCVDPRATYAEAKRAAEMLCAIYHKQFGLQIAIARIFALLGPYLSLDIHFAAGNFIRDAISGKKIVVNGNGRPCRSYLYAADLVVWLLTMLVRAESGKPYNVGSDESISIKDLANLIADTLNSGEVEVMCGDDIGWNQGRYVPNTDLIESELGVKRTVSLEEAILRTAIWNGWKN